MLYTGKLRLGTGNGSPRSHGNLTEPELDPEEPQLLSEGKCLSTHGIDSPLNSLFPPVLSCILSPTSPLVDKLKCFQLGVFWSRPACEAVHGGSPASALVLIASPRGFTYPGHYR